MAKARTLILRGGLVLTIAVVVGSGGFLAFSGRLESVEAPALDLTAHPSFRTWDEHAEIYARGVFPYTLKIEDPASGGALLYMGVQHSTDPENPQFVQLRREWAGFAPTVALNEGRSRYFRWTSGLIGGISDPKLAYILARRSDIPIYSIEPSYKDEVALLLEKWPAEVVACFFSTRVICAESGGDPARAEAKAAGLLAKRTDVDGLRGALTGVAELDRVWRELVPDGPDWRTLSNIDSVSAMRRVGDDSREVRGRHMVRAIAGLVSQGERVVAVVGASHVIRHEPTLRSLLAPARLNAAE